MLIEASVVSERGHNEVELSTDARAHAIEIAPRASGFGSRANGGELMCLALATCYCNDVYREAQSRAIEIVRVEVKAQATFGAAGEPASGFIYRVRVAARAPERVIRELIAHTDTMAEVHNTLRRGVPVSLEAFEAISVGNE